MREISHSSAVTDGKFEVEKDSVIPESNFKPDDEESLRKIDKPNNDNLESHQTKSKSESTTSEKQKVERDDKINPITPNFQQTIDRFAGSIRLRLRPADAEKNDFFKTKKKFVDIVIIPSGTDSCFSLHFSFSSVSFTM